MSKALAVKIGIPTRKFRDLLAMLASATDPVLSMLDQFGNQHESSPQVGKWRRTFGRFDPDTQPYCSMVYEADGAREILRLVELHEAPRGAKGEMHYHDIIGWVRITAFTSDSKLTTLASVMSGSNRVEVVRYRPRLRCTLRVHDENSGEIRYAKVFPDHRGEIIHRDSIALWQASQQGELGFHVARPGHWDAITRTLWQGCVPGAPIMDELASEAGADLAWRLGRACASLPKSTLRPSLRFSGADQLDRTARYVRNIRRYLPEAGGELESLLNDLADVHLQHFTRLLRPIHGAPHAHQWLRDGQELGLVDFDRFCLGDPELDVATFIAEMDFERPTRVSVEQLNQAFVDGYESTGVALHRPLLQAYRAHKRVAKALRSARAVRPDGAERALQHLARAKECLCAGMM